MQTKEGRGRRPRLSGEARLGVTLALLLGFAFLSNAQLLRRVLRQGLTRPGADEISVADRKFAALRPYAPNRGVIGLASNPRLEAAAKNKLFFEAQYALAPLVVVQATDRAWLIVDGGDEEWRPDCVHRGDFALVHRGMRGVGLYRRVPP